MTTALAHVIAARQRLRTLRTAVITPEAAARHDRTDRDLHAPAAALLQVLTSDAVLDHLDQALTEHIWAETLRQEDGVDYPGTDASALAAAIIPGKVQQPTLTQWKLLRRVAAGQVFRPVKGELVRLPKPVKKGKPNLTTGTPVNRKAFRTLVNLGLVETQWWWKGIEKAAVTDAGQALLAEHEQETRALAAA